MSVSELRLSLQIAIADEDGRLVAYCRTCGKPTTGSLIELDTDTSGRTWVDRGGRETVRPCGHQRTWGTYAQAEARL